jgi:hypothetical protein
MFGLDLALDSFLFLFCFLVKGLFLPVNDLHENQHGYDCLDHIGRNVDLGQFLLQVLCVVLEFGGVKFL